MTAARDLPASPLSISLTITHRRLWWQIDDEDQIPERWDVSADVWELGCCPKAARHVGDISIVIADLRRESTMLDSLDLGEWALEFIADMVIDPAQGLLHPELDEQISDGTARMLVLKEFALTEAWRGHGLGASLIAGVLRTLSPGARLAACRVSPLDFAEAAPDRMSAELASMRVGAILESIGFQQWRGVHVVDLRGRALINARMGLIERWWPRNGKP